MNWLRYVLLAVCILSTLAGYRKGLVRTVLSMVSLILVTGLAIWMNPYVTDVLNERTELPQYVEKKCLETFENNEFLSGENQDVQKKWLESMGVPEELVNQILGSGAVQEYQEEQLHSLASYAAKAVSEKIMKGIAFFLTLVLAVALVTIAVKIVELIAEIPAWGARYFGSGFSLPWHTAFRRRTGGMYAWSRSRAIRHLHGSGKIIRC